MGSAEDQRTARDASAFAVSISGFRKPAAARFCYPFNTSREFSMKLVAAHLGHSPSLFLSPGSVRLAMRRASRATAASDYYYAGPNVPSEFYWTPPAVHLQLRAAAAASAFAASGGGWSRDYPKADNDCLIALRRLTRINSPSPLNVADLDSDHIFDYPWIYAVDGEHLDLHRGGSQTPARLPSQGRLPDGGRFPRHRRLGALHGRHAHGAAGSRRWKI